MKARSKDILDRSIAAMIAAIKPGNGSCPASICARSWRQRLFSILDVSPSGYASDFGEPLPLKPLHIWTPLNCRFQVEIYNKPDFRYRGKEFAVLAINGWELLLKAKWLTNPGNPKSAKKPFFYANILAEFDKIYTRSCSAIRLFHELRSA